MHGLFCSDLWGRRAEREETQTFWPSISCFLPAGPQRPGEQKNRIRNI